MIRDIEVEIVLRLKASSHYVSRDELAQALGIPAPAVAEGIQGLSRRGYRIDHIPGQGYRLVAAPATLDGCDVKAALNTRTFGREILVFRSVGSTNDVAASLARAGSAEGTLVVSEQQSEGRGRLGRRWHSPPGAGLWFSLVLLPPLAAEQSATISLAGAVGVARALRSDYGIDAAIKWPNDVVVNGRKICGLLTEGEFSGAAVKFVVMGIGLNVLHCAQDFPSDLRQIATSVRLETGRVLSRTEVLSSVLGAVEAAYAVLCNRGFAPIRQDLLEHSTLLGKVVRVKTTAGEVEGTVHNIDSQGALVVRKDNGSLEKVIAGDVRMIA